jgi:CTD small phosphatase-like protein 2
MYGHVEQEFDEYEVDQFDPYQFIASLQSAMSPSQIVRRNAHSLPPRKPETPRMTLVLDLDETLVHCSTDPSEIPNPDFCFHVEFNGVNYSVCAKRRPGFDEFMEHIKDRFEIVVFTASQRVYAEKLMDILDPYHEYIMHRLYRDDCLNVEGNYLKDLASLGRDLAQTVIVDNSPQAFSLQLDNGIPILSWWNRPDDRELFKVCPLLDRLSVANDVRPILREKFQLFRKVEMKMQPCNSDSVLPPKALDYY